MKIAFIVLITWILAGSLFCQAQEITPLMQKIYALNDVVSDPERQVGSFDPDSMPSLPIGIAKDVGQSRMIIAIDSAYFLKDGAYFSAYMAVEFPGAEQRLAFAAKDIKFNPKGIIGGEQSKLMLVSQHIIELGPNTRLLLPSDGSNYVNWTCNGFESVNLHGYFLLGGEILSPPEGSADSVVTAEFQVNVTDMHNLMAVVNFSPFSVRGMEDFQFSVSEAYVDMSDSQNPLNVALPMCYQESYADNINLWRGFYLKYFSVKLPEELNKSESPVTIFAQNMFIDEAGVTGYFGAANIFNSYENAMNGEWGFSVDSLAVGLTLNKITRGKMSGDILIPPLDNAQLNYSALITQNATRKMVDFQFSVQPSDQMNIPCFNSTLTLFNTSSLQINRENKKFKPRLILHGNWTLNNNNWKFEGIGFENFTLITESPYVTNGYFSLLSNGGPPEAANFPVSFSNIGFGIISGNPVLGADVSLNLGDPDATGFSASTTVRVHTNLSKNPTTQKTEWKYDHFSLSTIHLAVSTQVISLNGSINFHENDPVYGKGFFGGLQLRIQTIMDNPMSMACAFGRVNGTRYWMVDATLPVNIPMGAITLTSLTGGVAWHMHNTLSNQQLIDAVSTTANSGASLSPNYVPDASAGLFFKAGVGFRNTAKEELLNGDVLFTISFNSNGGLSNISLNGDAYMMCKVSERLTSSNSVHGQVAINYDNQQKIFDAQLNMNAQFSGAITATIWSHLYFSPGLWYVHLGRPANPCTVNILNLAEANAYFMFGQNLDPMPAPPPQVASVFNTMNDQRNETDIAAGNGVACGMSLSASFDKTINLTDNIYLYGNGAAGAGFDMTLYKYASTTHCEGSSGAFGMNYWFLQGQLYAYLSLDVGAGWGNKDMTFIQGNTALLLQGKMPKPSYVYGGVYIQGSVFGVLNVDMTFDFDFGTNCVIMNG